MPSSDLLFPMLSAGLLFGLIVGKPGVAGAEEGSLAGELRALSQKRIYFGHQSVGNDLLAGIRDLSREANVPIEIVDAAAAGQLAAPRIVHAQLGENTRPLTKLAAFEGAMEQGWAGRSTIAFFKFCYVDIEARTDVRELFSRYVEAHQRLAGRYPDVTWVHVTVPLTVTQGGFKGYVKRLLGRAAAGERENVKRHEFNEFLRARFGGKEPIFDLALVESTWEDGRPNGFEWNGQTYPSLVAAYTEDGGHLDERGRRHAARALIRTLASLP